MASSSDISLSVPAKHYQHCYASRRRRLRDVIVRGFESLLRRKNSTIGIGMGIKPVGHQAASIDGRGVGYVVWVSRNELQRRENHDSVRSVDNEDATPLIVYGGAHDGLVTGALQQGIDSCDCLSSPLRWIRVLLELLPPPAPPPPPQVPRPHSAPSGTSPLFGESEDGWFRQDQAVAGGVHCRRYPCSFEQDSSGGGRVEGICRLDNSLSGAYAAEVSPTGISASTRAGGNFGGFCSSAQTECIKCPKTSRGTPMGSAPDVVRCEGGKNRPKIADDVDCSRGLGRALSGRGPREKAAAFVRAEFGSSGGPGAGTAWDGGCNQFAACSRGSEMARGQSLEREVDDLWWLTDPPPPRVSGEVFCLRVATETVCVLQTDAQEAPVATCTIEVCQGRPYKPGRLQRYPNMATLNGRFQAIHTYKVPTYCKGRRRPLGDLDQSDASSPDDCWQTLGAGREGGSLSSSMSSTTTTNANTVPPSASSQLIEPRREGDDEDFEVYITDVQPSYWYGVRQRFSWRIGAGSVDRFEEVVTGTSYVHTEAYVPPPTVPTRPHATLGCVRQQQQRRPQRGRVVEAQGDGGLAFHFRLRWGHGCRLVFTRGGTPQENEFYLQESIRVVTIAPSEEVSQDLDCPRSGESSRVATATTKGAKALSVTSLASQSRRAEGLEGKIVQGKLHAKSAGSLGWEDNSIARNKHHLVKGSGKNPHRSGKHRNDHLWHDGSYSPGYDRPPTHWKCIRNFDGGGDGNGHGQIVTPDVGRVGKSGAVEDRNGGDGHQPLGLSSGSHGKWGEWRTVCKTRQAARTMELPRVRGAGGGPETVGVRYRVGTRRREKERVRFSEVLEVPRVLLRRLYEIEEISSGRHMPPGFFEPRKRHFAEEISSSAGDEWEDDGDEGSRKEEIFKFVEAFAMSRDGDDFPARVARELQSKLWQGSNTEVTNEYVAEERARVAAEAESIQCALDFPINVRYIESVILQMDAGGAG